MDWIRSHIDEAAKLSAWAVALCSATCGALAFVPSSTLWISGVGLAGGAAGLFAVWAADAASKKRDEQIALSSYLSTTALETVHANGHQF